MKKIFLIIAMFSLSNIAKSQTIAIDSVSNKYQTSGILKIDSIAPDVLFSKTMEWIAINYNSANDVIQYSDKTTLKIIIKGAFQVNLFLKPGLIFHTAIFEFKYGKMKYTYSDFSYYSNGSGDMPFEKSMISKKNVIATTEQRIAQNLESIKNHVLTSSSSDW